MKTLIKLKTIAASFTLVIGLAINLAGVAQADFLGVAEYADTVSTKALYHLNQTSGTTANDDNSSGRSAINASLENSPVWTTGVLDNGLHFTRNSTQRLNMGNVLNTGSFTLEFYFKWDYIYTSELGNFFGADSTLFARGGLITHDPAPATAKVTFGVRDGSGNWRQIDGGDTYSLDTDWHHLAFVREYDAGNNQTSIRYYLDGQLAANTSWAGGYWTTSNPLIIGQTIGGTFDEIRLTPQALSTFGNTIPEPATMSIMGLGALMLKRRRP